MDIYSVLYIVACDGGHLNIWPGRGLEKEEQLRKLRQQHKEQMSVV